MKKYVGILLLLVFMNCKNQQKNTLHGRLNIVTTTTMITDLVANIGGQKVQVHGLMGSGVDPHLYKASEGDVSKLFEADIIFYNGLHLEGKLESVFEKMEERQKKTVAISNAVDKESLISSENFAANFDPHFWFDIQSWKKSAAFVKEQLIAIDPDNKSVYQSNTNTFLEKLTVLEGDIQKLVASLPKEKRILITAHDAFNYFGKAYGFEVVGLQGLSTATEAGVLDVQQMASYIIAHKVKAIFVESAVPRRTIEALQAAVRSKGHEVRIGGTLYADALGNSGTPEGTYLGMFRYNVETITAALR